MIWPSTASASMTAPLVTTLIVPLGVNLVPSGTPAEYAACAAPGTRPPPTSSPPTSSTVSSSRNRRLPRALGALPIIYVSLRGTELSLLAPTCTDGGSDVCLSSWRPWALRPTFRACSECPGGSRGVVLRVVGQRRVLVNRFDTRSQMNRNRTAGGGGGCRPGRASGPQMHGKAWRW